MILINQSLQSIEELNIYTLVYKYNLEIVSIETYPIVNISIYKDKKLLSEIQIDISNYKNVKKICSLNNILDIYDAGILIDHKYNKIYNYKGNSRDI